MRMSYHNTGAFQNCNIFNGYQLMMRKLFMSCAMLFVCTIACTQIITILDEEDGEPLELAILTNDVNSHFAMTNAEGQADISLMMEANVIEVRLFGYKTIQTSPTAISAKNNIISLTSEEISLDQVIVSASKWTQGTRDVPVRITSLSAREIALQNPQTAADL